MCYAAASRFVLATTLFGIEFSAIYDGTGTINYSVLISSSAIAMPFDLLLPILTFHASLEMAIKLLSFFLENNSYIRIGL